LWEDPVSHLLYRVDAVDALENRKGRHSGGAKPLLRVFSTMFLGTTNWSR
jgi:hypothetical protein